MAPIIEFEKVSKEFILRRAQQRTLAHRLLDLLTQGLEDRQPPYRQKFTALRDLDLAVEPGEAIGIIGENGSGKSTILKLVTRIIEPTAGRVQVRGRVAALLELGAGFHPELSGRENIYLNASILGMSHREIDRKLDEIVAFTEIEPFIDVPIKHYSSGMYMRLGFAVAVHVDPEVLLIDEVLAVGDFSFQRKCLERINDMRAANVTILFVSHNLDSVRKLCTRAIWLDHGTIVAGGDVNEVVDRYVDYMVSRQAAPRVYEHRFGSREVEITGVDLCSADGSPQTEFGTGDTLVVRIHYDAHTRIPSPVLGIAFYRADGLHLSGPNTAFSGVSLPDFEGRGTVAATIESLPFLQGRYVLSAAIYDTSRIHPYDTHEQSYPFRIVRRTAVRDQYGLIQMPVRWHVEDERRE